MTIDADIGNIVQQFGGTILTLYLIEQLWRAVDKLCGVTVIQKFRMADDVFQKGQVGGHPSDSEFSQCAIHSFYGFLRGRRPGSDFFK